MLAPNVLRSYEACSRPVHSGGRLDARVVSQKEVFVNLGHVGRSVSSGVCWDWAARSARERGSKWAQLKRRENNAVPLTTETLPANLDVRFRA